MLRRLSFCLLFVLRNQILLSVRNESSLVHHKDVFEETIQLFLRLIVPIFQSASAEAQKRFFFFFFLFFLPPPPPPPPPSFIFVRRGQKATVTFRLFEIDTSCNLLRSGFVSLCHQYLSPVGSYKLLQHC